MPRLFAVIPAAGSGSRLGGALPKQYLPLAGKPLLQHAVEKLCRHRLIERVFVVLARDDVNFAHYDWRKYAARLEPLYCGGPTRAASVLNGLLAMRAVAAPDDWVLVHDAARPCLPQAALERLIDELGASETGGLLALPVADTLKRAGPEGEVLQTEPRDDLWLAQTPQMFRFRLLIDALQHADPANSTDEACAVEALGLRPRLVPGDARNIKVTFAGDLALAELVLRDLAREENAAEH